MIRKEFIVGVVTTIGICGLIIGYWFLENNNFWNDSSTYYAVYSNANELIKGNKVKLNGVDVGKVEEVKLESNNEVIVKFNIDNPNVQKLPYGTIAKLNSDLLAGAYIEIQWNDTNVYYQNNDTLLSQHSKDIEDQINERLIPLEKKTNELISTADSAIKTIEAIFSRNTDNLDESFDGVRRAIMNFERVSLRVDTLIKSEKNRISRVLVNVENITSNLKESNEDIKNAFSNISQLSDSLINVDLVGTIDRAKTAIDQVNLLLDDIQNGDGTISHLIQDTLIYGNINLMIDEATRLVENIKVHPNRYLQFSVFGGREKSRLDSRDEKILKKFIIDSLNNGN